MDFRKIFHNSLNFLPFGNVTALDINVISVYNKY